MSTDPYRDQIDTPEKEQQDTAGPNLHIQFEGQQMVDANKKLYLSTGLGLKMSWRISEDTKHQNRICEKERIAKNEMVVFRHAK